MACRGILKGDPRHGTSNGYLNHHCRCLRCTAAHTKDQREQRHRLGYSKPLAVYLAELDARAVHGSKTMYERRGCKCALCRAWSRDKKARQRARHAK